MNITCQRAELQTAVLNISRVVATKSPIPALEGILFKATETSIFLCGYDLNLGITTEIPAVVREEGAVIFSGKLFGDIIRSLPDNEVTVTVDEKFIASIRSGESEFHIVGIAASEYPDIPSVSGGTEFSIPQPTLKSMIRQTLFAVSTSDSKPIHTGAKFDIKNRTLRVVAVDGCRLAMRSEAINCDEVTDFVVPGRTLGEALKLMEGDDGDVQIGVGRRHIVMNVGNYAVISRLLEGDFLDFDKSIPRGARFDITVPTRRFIEAVERMSLVVSERLKSPIHCKITGGEIRFSCETAIGTAADRFAIEPVDDEIEIGFNYRYLLDAFRAAETDEVRVQIIQNNAPVKILPKEGDSFLFLVLPVMLKAKS